MERGPCMSRRANHLVAVAAEVKIHVSADASVSGDEDSPSSEIYDTATSAWVRPADSTPRGGISGTLHQACSSSLVPRHGNAPPTTENEAYNDVKAHALISPSGVPCRSRVRRGLGRSTFLQQSGAQNRDPAS